MKKLWFFISSIGLDDKADPLFNREKMIFNRIIFLLLITFFFILVVDIIDNINKGAIPGISLVRTIILIVFCFIHLILNRFRFFKFSKILLSIQVPFFLIVFPTLLGNSINEYFLWYPYVPAAISIIPHFIFNYKTEKVYLILTLGYYLILAMIIDHLLFIFNQGHLDVIPIIKENYFIYKVSNFIFFAFINAALFYLFNTNKKYENTIMQKNRKLETQQEELRSQNEELRAQQDELNDKNQELETILSKLKETQAKLVQSEKMASLGTLLSGVAHEINNPLNFIYGSAEGIKMNLDECEEKTIEELFRDRDKVFEEIRQMLKGMQLGVDNISDIVKSLMTFSQRNESKLIETDLNRIIDNTLQILNHKIPEQVKIEKHLGNLPLAMCYQDKMHQVLLSILENGLDAILEKKNLADEKIIIDTQVIKIKNKDYVQISISNTGPHIPDDVIDNIFDPFFTTKDPDKGTGLGLSISYKLIEEHNGNLIVRNVDSLVKFCIQIPVSA